MHTPIRLLSLGLLAAALLAPRHAFAAAASTAADDTAGEDDGSKPAKAESPSHSLEDRIRPVSGSLFLRAGRSELTPVFDLSLNDAFFQKYMFGLKYDFHVSESFALELGGAFGFSTASGTVNKCTADGCATPAKEDLAGAPGNVTLIAGLSALWSPLYGKLNLVGEKVIHFDTFFLAGLDGIQYQKPVLNAGESPSGAFTFGGHFGVGQHFVVNEWSAIRLQLEDYLYAGQRSTAGGTYNSHLENQLMLELGFSFFFPLHPSNS